MAEIKSAIFDLMCRDLAQALIASILIVGTLLLLLTDRPVPEWLVVLDTTAATFYFTLQGARGIQNNMPGR